MKILIAEDESDISHTYRVALESRNHDVEITDDGVKCIQVYREELAKRQASSYKNMKHNSILQDSRPTPATPFDVVVLDYKMPGKDGMEVAKEILATNPDQRIIFASAYVKETLEHSVKQLKRVVELLQKPFEMKAFIDTIEDKQVYEELKKMMINIRAIDHDNSPSSEQDSSDSAASREQMRDLFECLRKIQKNRTF
jgi:CheY-like chemotaxis protein